MKKKISFRDVDKPLKDYPEDTIFVLDHDDVSILMPTKEEIEEYFKEKESTSQ